MSATVTGPAPGTPDWKRQTVGWTLGAINGIRFVGSDMPLEGIKDYITVWIGPIHNILSYLALVGFFALVWTEFGRLNA